MMLFGPIQVLIACCKCFVAVWRIIKSWLTEEQKERILFAKKKDIQQYINADQLEEDMLK